MSAIAIVFTVIYCLVLCCYFYTETSGNMKLRAPNKILLALMFFVFGTAYALVGIDRGMANLVFGYATPLLILGLLLAALGDIFLLFVFPMGGAFFASCNFAFIAFQLAIFSYYGIAIQQFWWVFIVILALWSIYPILTYFYPDAFKFGKFKGPMFFYLATIVASGSFGIATTVYIPELRLLGIGLILFMLSDFDIILHKFVWPKNKWIHRLNSALYFTGLLLIVLNVSMLVG